MPLNIESCGRVGTVPAEYAWFPWAALVVHKAGDLVVRTNLGNLGRSRLAGSGRLITLV